MERNAARPELDFVDCSTPARPRRSRRSPRRNPRQRGRNGAYRHSATERCWGKSNVTPSPCAEASFPAPDAISKQFSQSRLRLEVEAARCRRGETGADVRPRDGLGPSYRRAVECTSTAAGRKASADLSSKLPWRPCRPTRAVLAARQKHRVARCCCRRQGWCGYEFALSHPKTPLAGSDGLQHHRLVHAIVRCVVCASPMCPRPRLDLRSQSVVNSPSSLAPLPLCACLVFRGAQVLRLPRCLVRRRLVALASWFMAGTAFNCAYSVYSYRLLHYCVLATLFGHLLLSLSTCT